MNEWMVGKVVLWIVKGNKGIFTWYKNQSDFLNLENFCQLNNCLLWGQQKEAAYCEDF